jgi:hypothetical protein
MRVTISLYWKILKEMDDLGLPPIMETLMECCRVPTLLVLEIGDFQTFKVFFTKDKSLLVGSCQAVPILIDV